MGRSKKRKRNFLGETILHQYWKESFNTGFVLPMLNHSALEEKSLSQDVNELLLRLQLEKSKLNQVKSLLNGLDIVEWRKHTTKMHKCAFIVPQLRNKVKAEFVTQAWAKFFTILSTFSLLKKDVAKVNSLHLCEAPGGFIAALNHYLQNEFGAVLHNWVATTLNPYYDGNDLGQMIPDDRFIIETLSCWDFGPDFTGNLMSKEFLDHIKKKFGSDDVHLVTADGSVDCSEDPGEQENMVSLLFLWETVTAISVLSDHGTFVLKIFTVFEKVTICLLHFLCNVFGSVVLFKPGPSKAGNSEVYVVCIDFMKDKCQLSGFDTFLRAAVAMDFTLCLPYFERIPFSFLQVVEEYVQHSSCSQISVIEANLKSYKKLTTDEEDELKCIKNYIAAKFIREFRVRPIYNPICPGLVQHDTQTSLLDSMQMRLKYGSYDDRQSAKRKFNFKEERDYVPVKVEDYVASTENWYQSADDPGPLQNFTHIIGKKFQDVISSLFCTPNILEASKKLVKSCKDAEDETWFGRYVIAIQMSTGVDLSQVERIRKICTVHSSCQCFEFVLKRKLSVVKTGNVDCIDTQSMLAVCHLSTLSKSKVENLASLSKLLSMLKEKPSNVMFQFDALVLSNFWYGVLFLFSQLFSKLSPWMLDLPSQSYVVAFIGFHESNLNVCDVISYFESLQTLLCTLPEDNDILHVVPIYDLMKSAFRRFIKSTNDHVYEISIPEFK